MKGLIYDVGVHVGDDTAYYLSRGFRVVGIEADPLLANELRARFADEISRGDLMLLNVGVGERDGEADFWVSERPLWSSFDKTMASRDGLKCYPIKVQTTTLGNIISKTGAPLYCKIDVEGYDRTCARSLTKDLAPKYISIELDTSCPREDLDILRDLGYTKFKVMSQVTRAQPSPALMSLACSLPYRAAEFLRRLEGKLRGVTSLEGWKFGGHSSGPFGEDTPGPWRSYSSALELLDFLKAIDGRREAKGLHEWFDLHAMNDPPAVQVP